MSERRATLGLAGSLPGIVLVVVIVWALAAVLMLTGTLINAREINDTLPLINNQVKPINQDLDNVRLAEETARISGRIDEAAANLSNQADRIITEAENIDGNAAKILRNARSVNERAKSINATVRSINGRVNSINSNVVSISDNVDSILGNVLSINGTVGSIAGSVTTINARVDSIFSRVGPVGARGGSIKASVSRIFRTFTRLSPKVRSIDSGVAGINRRASAGVVGVASLKTDFEPILGLVGRAATDPEKHNTTGPGTIHGHANSIDCSALINSAGPTQYCSD